MYYENKRSFYIKQYGPVAIVVLIAFVLLVAGVLIGVKSMNNSNVVAEKPKQDTVKSEKVETVKTEEVKSEEVKIVDTNAYTYTESSMTGKVTKVNGLTVTVESNNSTYDINLIGIMLNDKNPELSTTMKDDLVGKTVTVDYDNVKTEDGKVYGYIYIDNVLYNKTLLANGLAELRPERQNIDKLDVLLAAQIDARHEGKGIWTLK